MPNLRSLLKGLGLTVWGGVAVGIVTIFILVGLHAVFKYRASLRALISDESKELPAPASLGGESSNVGLLAVAPVGPSPQETRRLLESAFQSGRFTAAVGYGRVLVDENAATPSDLWLMAQAYFAMNDCDNALLFASKANATSEFGRRTFPAVERFSACCIGGQTRVYADSDSTLKERISRLLQKTAADKAQSGWPLVRMGELYYGFGQYDLAIASIQRGLAKGGIPRLDEAYVYLGRSAKAYGDLELAREAFAKLKDVPDISPRILRLWTLYAETQLGGKSPAAVERSEQCQR